MKTPQVILLLLASTALLFVASLGSCFGQTDTNLLASGDWSKPVQDDQGYTLRGRLLVYDEHNAPNHARIYLELQHLFKGPGWWDNPIEIYYDRERGDVLHFEMRDGLNQPIPMYPVSIAGPVPSPYLITLPCDSTIRLRADWENMGPPTQPDGLEIFVVGGCWLIPPDATNDFYLSASFTPPKELPSGLNGIKYHIWQGTLNLPKVQIPVQKPIAGSTDTKSTGDNFYRTIVDTNTGTYAVVDSRKEVVTLCDKSNNAIWTTNVIAGLPPDTGTMGEWKIHGLEVSKGQLFVGVGRGNAVIDIRSGVLNGYAGN